MMLRKMAFQLPDWARFDHPHLRFALGPPDAASRRVRYLRALFAVTIFFVFLGGGYLVASDFLDSDPFDLPLSQMLIEILFWPTFAFQILLQISALTLTINTVGEAKRRQLWDSIRATSAGAELTLRSRWERDGAVPYAGSDHDRDGCPLNFDWRHAV